MSPRRRLLAPLLAPLLPPLLVVLLAAVLSGCVTMPTSGPVVDSDPGTGTDPGRATAIDPLPPQEGDSQVQIAQGFLEAMTATPIQTSVAQEFLAEDARTSWNPDRATIVYDDSLPPVEVPGGAQVRLTGAEELDSRGAWVGDLPAAGATLRLRMVLERDGYRIENPPDALVVPAAWFEQRFRQVSLYFFDRTGQILVPESVFVPRGQQLASTLTERLLAGPAGPVARVTRNALPAGLTLGLSVPISADGVAQVELTGEPPPSSSDAVERLLAQLTWTLRQDPTIEALRVSIGGEPVTLPGGSEEVRIDSGAAFSPTGYQATTLLFALDEQGRLVSGTGADLQPVPGPLGQEDFGLRTVAVGALGEDVVGVTADGTRLLRSRVRDDGRGEVQEVLSGATDLLRPSWDFAGRVWLVDRTSRGARVLHVDGQRVRTLRVPGVTGRDVRQVLVSRDATRLVAVVRDRDTDRVQTARIVVDDQGQVTRALRGTAIGAADRGRLRVRDMVWSSATTVALLSKVGRADLAEVRTVTVDGAPTGLSSLSSTVRGGVESLAGTPIEGEPTYGVTGDGLVDLDDGQVAARPGPLRSLTYAG